MRPSHMPLALGARPISGMQGFPHVMISADGLSYGPATPDGFPMLDLSRVKRCYVQVVDQMMTHNVSMDSRFTMMIKMVLEITSEMKKAKVRKIAKVPLSRISDRCHQLSGK